MNQIRWDEAAERYKQAIHPVPCQIPSTPPPRPQFSPEQIQAGADGLRLWLQSAVGLAGIRLLAASGEHVLFWSENEGGGYVTNYYLDAIGLKVNFEISGMGATINRTARELQSGLITADKMASECALTGRDPRTLVEILQKQIDQIATAAPR